MVYCGKLFHQKMMHHFVFLQLIIKMMQIDAGYE